MNTIVTPQAHAGDEPVRDEAAPAAGARAPRPWSLRNRLMWLAGLTTVLAWLIGGVATLIAVHHESERDYDERLRDVARVILSFANHEIEEIKQAGRTDMVHLETAATLDSRYAYQIWSKDGELLLLSHNAPRESFAPLGHVGMLEQEIGGRPHSFFTQRSADGSMQIQVAEDQSMRHRLVRGLNIWLLAFVLVSTLLLLVFIRWTFGRAMRALDQSAQQLIDRSADDLRPIHADDPPQELRPLLKSINTLFGRFERTLDLERRFTAAAAHELRTPLAAIKIQAQVAERARTHEEGRHALRALQFCVERAAHMIDQLLTLARVESIAPSSVWLAEVRVDRVAEQVVRDLSHVLAASEVRVDVQAGEATVHAFEFGVAALIRNVIENAVHYSPRGGHVRVRTFTQDGRATLSIEDSGPGIPESERIHVFERFYRLSDVRGDGCGVGLSIVRSVATAHRARLELGTSILGGLHVSVVFPQDLTVRPGTNDAG